jgi:chromosome partitioning protein
MSQQTVNGGHIIVLGNEKGGSGKSTSAMHIIVSLLKQGYTVGSIDLDQRQASLSRYIENRQTYAKASNIPLLVSDHRLLSVSTQADAEEREREELQAFLNVLEDLRRENDYVVIDCPGSNSFLARVAHARADTLVTPMNDSFVDLDLLARVDPETNKVISPSFYSELVWESRKQRALGERATIDWIVMRNRTSSLDARNKRRVYDALVQLEKRINFRHIEGLGERVIYRELFLRGLTLLDFGDGQLEEDMTMSHVAARQELRRLMDGLNLPNWGRESEVRHAVAS